MARVMLSRSWMRTRRDRLRASWRTSQPGTIAIGPEGGFTVEELRIAAEHGALPVHLGRRVLRAETAALAALVTINAIVGDAR